MVTYVNVTMVLFGPFWLKHFLFLLLLHWNGTKLDYFYECKHTHTRVVEAALVPLREAGIHVLIYLDDWLILALSQALLCEHRDTVLCHLSRLGLQVNWEKRKFSPVQRISFLGMELNSVNLTARLSLEHAQSMLNCLESLQSKRAVPLKHFQRLLGHMASAVTVTPLGLLHMRPLQLWLHDRAMALAMVKRVGDLQAFSVDDSCLGFGPGNSHDVLRPRLGYVPKIPTTPFRDQVVNLQALPRE